VMENLFFIAKLPGSFSISCRHGCQSQWSESIR
jgi:hypothetical protein